MGRLFARIGSDRTDAATEAGETETEIGILGDVPGIPAERSLESRAAEVIGGAAQRNWRVSQFSSRL